MSQEGVADGEIVVAGFLENRQLKVSVRLSSTDYARAAAAHVAGQTVYCEGELVPEGRSYRLLNPRNFSVNADG